MKPYPKQNLYTDNEFFEIPTQEACAKFLEYLDDEELKFYNLLVPARQLSIAISVNPFRAFESLYMEYNHGRSV